MFNTKSRVSLLRHHARLSFHKLNTVAVTRRTCVLAHCRWRTCVSPTQVSSYNSSTVGTPRCQHLALALSRQRHTETSLSKWNTSRSGLLVLWWCCRAVIVMLSWRWSGWINNISRTASRWLVSNELSCLRTPSRHLHHFFVCIRMLLCISLLFFLGFPVSCAFSSVSPGNLYPKGSLTLSRTASGTCGVSTPASFYISSNFCVL